MISILKLAILPILIVVSSNNQTGYDILEKVDANMASSTRIVESSMVVYGKRSDRTISSISYSEGNTKSFTEYLSPERDKGTKMLKLDDKLWIYSPLSDRTIQLSGHMLKQSVMGSDLSYDDVVDDRELRDVYDVEVMGEETVDGRKCWILLLTAKVADVTYINRQQWIDQERYVPLKEELFAKSGELLKKVTLTDVTLQDGRWFPMKMNYKDMLKSGQGTDFIINRIQFNVDIPDYIFSKASLKK